MSDLLKHIVMFYKYGGKQLYYNNTHDGQGEIDVDRDVANTVEVNNDDEQFDEDDCESCKI